MTGAVSGDCSAHEGATTSESLGGLPPGGLRNPAPANQRTDRAGSRVVQANPLVREAHTWVRPRPSEGRRSDDRSPLRPAVRALVRRISLAVAQLAGPAHRRDLAGVARLQGDAGQYGQHLAERGVDFDVGERVATGRAPVDDCHRDPRLPSPVHEAQP